jgi:pseudaminic acid synthase
MTPTITIGKRRVGPGYPTYIIAEMSSNHNQDFATAQDLVHAAKEAGADAIKLQTFTPEVHTLDLDSELFRVKGGTVWDDQTLFGLYKRCYMPWDWQPRLKEVADHIGIDLFSAAVDQSGVDFLEGMGVPVHKVASFEIVDLPLIERMAATGKPLIISTGMANLCEIQDAINAARKVGADQIALLKCTSAYPAPADEMNLLTIPHLKEMFDVPVGLSDHTLGNIASVVAVTLGAAMIERHFTLSRSIKTPDASFSLEPTEFRTMVDAIREAEKMRGKVQYGITEHEKPGLIFRRSLFVIREIKKGDKFSKENIRSIRPGFGLKPKFFNTVLGKRAVRDISRGTPLSWDLVDPGT